MEMYFVALLPPSELENQISSFKHEVKRKYGSKAALKLPAHITLKIPFKMPEEQEVRLQEELAMVARETNSFKLCLSGFGCFPPRVIFIEVDNNEPLSELFSKIHNALEGVETLGKAAGRSYFHPHITIATRDLKREDFHPAWKEFKERTFTETFMVHNFHLFKHNGKSWDILGKYPLQP